MTTKKSRFSQVSTKLSPDQVRARAFKFGLTSKQFDKLTCQVFETSTTVIVYPGNSDTERLIDFLTHDLIGKADGVPLLG